MNENIDLTKILKDCPKGTKLYSPIFGDVMFERIDDNGQYPIIVKYKSEKVDDWWDYIRFTKEGLFINKINTECTLFPAKDQRDWSKFKAPWYKKERFDPKTLKPFDKVLVRMGKNDHKWLCDLFSYFNNDTCKYHGVGYCANYCIPYNEETKHLLGTNNEAPEYYRYWEE